MLDVHAQKKAKIALADYDYQKDIQNRLVFSKCNNLDLLALEEILFSPLRFSLTRMMRNLGVDGRTLLPILEKFAHIGLLEWEGDDVSVDKDMRKYCESQAVKFREGFHPDIEHIMGLLKKVPIHVLPSWYAIPRSSNNIFDSLIEKHLLTPALFCRHLQDFYHQHPDVAPIAKHLFGTAHLELSLQEIMDTHQITHEQCQEYILLMEFYFICGHRYKKYGDQWSEVIVPLYEWAEYLRCVRSESRQSLATTQIRRYRQQDFSFVEDGTLLLRLCQEHPMYLEDTARWLLDVPSLGVARKTLRLGTEYDSYIARILEKLCLIDLATTKKKQWIPTRFSEAWCGMSPEERAIHLYRHPQNRPLSSMCPHSLYSERNVRETEKSLQSVLHAGWVQFDDFLQSAIVGFTDQHMVSLKRVGKGWKYCFPQYDEPQREFIKSMVLDSLFEAGVVAIGVCMDKPCFTVTQFGQTLFGK